jgi:hypothetical protein
MQVVQCPCGFSWGDSRSPERRTRERSRPLKNKLSRDEDSETARA